MLGFHGVVGWGISEGLMILANHHKSWISLFMMYNKLYPIEDGVSRC